MEQWIAEACRLIRYGPDRETVSQELRNHMEDVYAVDIPFLSLVPNLSNRILAVDAISC